MVTKPYIKCDRHGSDKIRGYIWCMHITLAIYQIANGNSKITEDDLKENLGLVIAPTESEYGLILCSTLVEHPAKEDSSKWNLVCEKCLMERGWIKSEGQQSPMVTLARELPKELDWSKAGLKRRS